MSFQLIEQLQQKDNTMAVKQLCRVLEVSRSGDHVARKLGQTAPAVCQAGVHLKAAFAAFAASGCAYGSRRLRAAMASRGGQYASDSHRALLNKHGLVGSMSRKGNRWDYSVIERFFLNLRMERVWQRDYANHGEVCAAALQAGQLATQCFQAEIDNQSTYRCVRDNLTMTHIDINWISAQSARFRPALF